MAIITIGRILISCFIISNSETPYELYSIGCQLELNGNVAEAVEYYKKALTQDPQATEIYYALANASYKLRNYSQGIAYAENGLTFAPENTDLYSMLAVGYIGQGNFKKAINAYTRALQYVRDNLDIYYAIATLYEGTGDLKMAKQTMLDVPDSLKNSEVYTALGTITGKSDDHQGAIQYYQKAISLDTTNAIAIIGIGTGFDIMGMKDSSIYYYEKALVYDSTLEVHKRLVDLYSDMDQFEKLISIARNILAMDYYDVSVRRSLAYALYKTGVVTESFNEFLLVTGLDRDDSYARFYLGKIYLEQGKFDQAQEEIAHALDVDPDFVELWVYLGFIAIDRRDYKTAAHAFKEAAYRGADRAQVFYLLGVVAEMEQMNENAYFYYKKSLAVNPSAVASLEALANLCERLGKKREAVAAFTKIIGIDSTDAAALNYVGYMYAENGESLEYALVLIDRALAIEPNNGYYIDSRGWVFFRMGKFEDALIDLKKAATLVEDPVIFEHLGDVCAKMNRPAEARDAYEKSMLLDPVNRVVKKKLAELKMQK